MSLLANLTGGVFWRPRGWIPSLAQLDAAHGLTAKWDPAGPAEGGQPLTVVELAGGKVAGDLQLAVTRNDLVIGGIQSLHGTADPSGHPAYQRGRFRVTRRRKGTALLLGAADGHEYDRWMLDLLPRWKILHAAPIPHYDFVLLPERAAPFQDETLGRLNVPSEKRLRCAKKFVHEFDRLIIPAMPSPRDEVAPWACKWVRSLFPEPGVGPARLFLAPPSEGAPRLVNQKELENALLTRGFTVILADRMAVAEQARIFRRARLVVGTCGAPLASLMFAPPGAFVIELFHPGHKNGSHASLASICGHRHAGLDGEPAGRKPNVLEYRVDVAAVLRKLQD